MRGGGGLLDGPGGLRVGAQVSVQAPGTPCRVCAMVDTPAAAAASAAARPRRRLAVAGLRGDDKDQVGGTLADRATDPVGQLGGRVLGSAPSRWFATATLRNRGWRRPAAFPGRTASSRALPEFCPAASPRVRLSRLRLAPARRNAYSRPPRSADSWPGRAVTARTEAALGGESSRDSLGVLGRGMVGVVVIVLSWRVRFGYRVAGHLLSAGPAVSTLAGRRAVSVQWMWRSDGSCTYVSRRGGIIGTAHCPDIFTVKCAVGKGVGNGAMAVRPQKVVRQATEFVDRLGALEQLPRPRLDGVDTVAGAIDQQWADPALVAAWDATLAGREFAAGRPEIKRALVSVLRHSQSSGSRSTGDLFMLLGAAHEAYATESELFVGPWNSALEGAPEQDQSLYLRIAATNCKRRPMQRALCVSASLTP